MSDNIHLPRDSDCRQATNLDFNDVGMRAGGEESIRTAFANATIALIAPGSLSPMTRKGPEPTEESLAREWATNNAASWRYDHNVGRWFEWNGTNWQKDETGHAFDLIGRHIQHAAQNTNSPSIARASVARGVHAFAIVNRRVAVTHDGWDADPMLLGTPGGTVDLKTGKLRKPRQADRITKLTSVAPAEGEPTRWLAFLREALGKDDGMIRFIRQWLGYCLTGDTREHQLVFTHGPGGNGKSVLLNTATAILSDYAVTAAMETFTASRNDRHPTELAMLTGARLVTASETEEGRAWAEARIKQMTGGDPITAHFMRQDNFTFRPQFKLMFAGNYAPSLHNVDEAMRRRFNLVPFTHTPAKPDRELEQKLTAEHGQILQWMIEGCLDWQAKGLVRPHSVTAATAEYFASQDMVTQWIAERCQTGEGKSDTPTKLYNSWCDFAREVGEETGSMKSLKDALAKRGHQPKRSNGLRLIDRIALNSLPKRSDDSDA